jgi:hypothetical protein
MCDLKRTLDATVSYLISSFKYSITIFSRATVCSRCRRELARQYRSYPWLSRISRCTSFFLHLMSQLTLYLHEVLSYSPETYLLFAYSSGNRESAGWAEKINGIPNIMCRDGGGEDKGVELHGTGTDEPQESLHTSRGVWFCWMHLIDVDVLELGLVVYTPCRSQRKRKEKLWMHGAAISQMLLFVKRGGKIQVRWNYATRMRCIRVNTRP